MSSLPDCKSLCQAFHQRPTPLSKQSILHLDFFKIPLSFHPQSLIVIHLHLLTEPFSRFINNEFVKGTDGKTFESINPSTEKPIVAVHEATEKDVDIAVSVARKTFEGPWKKVTPGERGKLLVKLADLFEQNLDQLAAIEALDNGKAFNIAKIDINMCAGCLRYYGGWADKIEGRVIDTNSETFNYTKQEPVSQDFCPLNYWI